MEESSVESSTLQELVSLGDPCPTFKPDVGSTGLVRIFCISSVGGSMLPAAFQSASIKTINRFIYEYE